MRRTIPGLVALALILGVLWMARRALPPVAPPRADAGSDALHPTRPVAPRTPPLQLPWGSRSEDATATRGLLAGRVLSTTTGRGVPHATLTLLHDGAALTVDGGSDGAFRLEPPGPGRYTLLEIHAQGYLPFAPQLGDSPIELVARAGERLEEITLYLEPAEECVGVVLSPSEQPVGGAQVLRRDEGAAGERWTTDGRGEFRFRAPEEALLEARAAGFGPGRALYDQSHRAAHKLVIHLQAPGDGGTSSLAIEGRVIDPTGAPLSEARVKALPEGAARLPGARAELIPVGQAVTNEAGRYRLEALDAGDYLIDAQAPGFAPGRARAHAGATDVTVTLRAGCLLRGKVRDGNGRPAVGFTVVATARRGPLERGPSIAASFLDGSGRYQLDQLAPGSYAVTVVARGWAPAPERAIEVAPGAPAEADFTLLRGGRLSGRVIEAGSGRALPGARIGVEGVVETDGSPLATVTSTTSDARGEFALAGLAPGLRSILITCEGHHGRLLSGLRVEGDGDLGPLVVELSATEPGESPHIELVGIGAVLSARGDVLVIGQVFPGGGAAEVGLAPGDAILAVDGQAVVALGFAEAVQLIRGPEGSSVRLTVRRGSGGDPVELVVPRRRVHG